jgi:hypothetical protein
MPKEIDDTSPFLLQSDFETLISLSPCHLVLVLGLIALNIHLFTIPSLLFCTIYLESSLTSFIA